MSVIPSATSEKVRAVAGREEHPDGAATALTVRRWRMTREGRWWLITGALLWVIGVSGGCQDKANPQTMATTRLRRKCRNNRCNNPRLL